MNPSNSTCSFLPAAAPTLQALPTTCVESPVKGFSRRSLLPQRPQSMWKIENGAVRTNFLLEDGTIVTLGIWGPGDIVGVALSGTEKCEIECLTRVWASSIPSEHCRNTDWLISVVKQSEELSIVRGQRHIERRLRQSLLWLSNKFGSVVESGNRIDLRMTHQDLADLIGSTRVTVTRLLNQFEDQGWIERQSIHRIVLKEQDFWHYEI